VFLDDSAGLINLGNSWTFNAENRQDTSANAHIFVGNNSTANGGNNAGSTQTGSTIALGAFISAHSSPRAPGQEIINITGANGYKLQLASIAFPDLTSKFAASAYTMTMNPTTAPVIVAGGVTPFASGNTNSTPVLDLGGTATGNEIQGVIANPSNVGTSNPLSLTKSNTSTWTLTNAANTYTGTTTVSGGTLQISTLNNGGPGNNSNIGASTNAAANLVLNGGTLRYTGGAVSTDRLFSVGTTAGSAINASGTGALNFSNTGAMGFNAQTGARTLTLTGTNTGNNTIAAAIGDNTGATAIAKTGIGTWVLSGANGNTGATNISGGGTLVLDYGTSGGATDNNKIAGILTLTNGAGDITLRGGSHVEAVTSTSLTTGGGHTSITREVGSTATLSLGAISRSQSGGVTLSLAAGNLATTTSTAFRGMLGGGITVGSNWAKVASGNIIALTTSDYTGLPTGNTTTTVNYELSGSQTHTGSASMNSLRIVGTGGTDQTLDLGANQMQLGSVSAASPNNHTFGTSGGLLYAGGGTNNYTITGSGGIRGQNANQELIVNTFTGTLTLDIAVATGSSSTGLTKTGEGILILTKAATYSGVTFVNQGALQLRDITAAGTATNALGAGIVVANKAALELANNVAIGTEALTITGNGSGTNTGALRSVSTNTSSTSYAGAITIGAGGARINNDSTTAPLTLSGGITTSLFNDVTFGGAGNTTVSTAISGAGNVIKDGTGTLTLSATNTYTGATIVNDGKLVIGSGGTDSITSNVTVNDGGTLGGSGTINGTATISGILAPGNSIGSLAMGPLVLNGTSTFAYEINKDAAVGVAGDLTAVTGSLTINTGSLLTLMELGAGTWTPGEKLTLISYTSAWNNGLFLYDADGPGGAAAATLADDSTFSFSGVNWLFNYNDTVAGTNYTGNIPPLSTFVTMTVIPETSTALLSGLGALALLRRRRN
jgi:fibronectin-binding autotransporter adhesin